MVTELTLEQLADIGPFEARVSEIDKQIATIIQMKVVDHVYLFLNRLGTNLPFQGQGFAAAIFPVALDYAKDHGCKYVVMRKREGSIATSSKKRKLRRLNCQIGKPYENDHWGRLVKVEISLYESELPNVPDEEGTTCLDCSTEGTKLSYVPIREGYLCHPCFGKEFIDVVGEIIP